MSGFYSRDGVCLLRGTDWIFKYNSHYIYKCISLDLRMQANCVMHGKRKTLRYLALILVFTGLSKGRTMLSLRHIYGQHVVLLTLNLWVLESNARSTWGCQTSGFTSFVPRSLFRYNSCIPVASKVVGVKMEPVKVAKVIRSEKGKYIVIKGFKFRFQKNSCRQNGTMVLY